MVVRLYVSKLEFFRELDLLIVREGQRGPEDIEGLSLVVVRLNVSVLEFFREFDLLLVREGQGGP